MSRYIAYVALIGVALLTASALGSDWPGFRGPNGNGVSSEVGLPVRWGPDLNLAWKVRLPGFGSSSPVVAGGRVYLTYYSGYGIKKGGDMTALRRHLLCLDRKAGQVLWDRPVEPKLPESEFLGPIVQHGYATPTPATDGRRIYVFHGRTGVLAYDLDGTLAWQTEVGKSLNGWGSGASPVVYKELVIINASVEGSALIALDRATGKEVWRHKGVGDCWSTPLLVDLAGGKVELILNAADAVRGIDPDRGEELWRCEGLEAATASASPVARDGIVYVAGAGVSGKRAIMAIRAGGRGDVSETHVLWKQPKAGGNHASPVLYGDYLYYVNGVVTCLRADTGAVVYQERLYDTRQEYASPVAGDGKVFAVTRHNGTYVLNAGGKFVELARNDLDDTSDFNASPAVSDGQIFLRSNVFLYCIGKK